LATLSRRYKTDSGKKPWKETSRLSPVFPSFPSFQVIVGNPAKAIPAALSPKSGFVEQLGHKRAEILNLRLDVFPLARVVDLMGAEIAECAEGFGCRFAVSRKIQL
jgi:hypothetical protein